MSFRTDKKRGSHPITPKKGIKETDLNIKEKGNNDTIAVAIKPGNKKSGSKEVGIEKIKPEDLIDEIIWHMRNDDSDQTKESDEIRYMYARLSPELRTVLDNFYIFMTGYSLGTIIKDADTNHNSITNQIINLQEEDDQDPEVQSKMLYQYYKRMSPLDKQAVDNMMMHTTGYEMNSLLYGKTIWANRERPTDWNLPPAERRPDD